MMPDFVFLLPIAGVSFALENSNISGKVIVLVLFVGSIFAWSVMLTKGRQLKEAAQVSERFLDGYHKAATPLGLSLKRLPFDASPLYQVYTAVCREIRIGLETRGLDPEDLFSDAGGLGKRSLDQNQIAAVRNVAERTVADQVLLFENHMGVIATATTTAPYLGLLGTVWGVMDSFSGMASKGTAMLSAVAPGISGALLTTVVGLLVALPSAIGYNMLSDRIRKLAVKTDNFSQELVADIERLYVR